MRCSANDDAPQTRRPALHPAPPCAQLHPGNILVRSGGHGSARSGGGGAHGGGAHGGSSACGSVQHEEPSRVELVLLGEGAPAQLPARVLSVSPLPCPCIAAALSVAAAASAARRPAATPQTLGWPRS